MCSVSFWTAPSKLCGDQRLSRSDPVVEHHAGAEVADETEQDREQRRLGGREHSTQEEADDPEAYGHDSFRRDEGIGRGLSHSRSHQLRRNGLRCRPRVDSKHQPGDLRDERADCAFAEARELLPGDRSHLPVRGCAVYEVPPIAHRRGGDLAEVERSAADGGDGKDQDNGHGINL
jgi:hypothetical protein